MPTGKLHIVPLGGLGEFGMNCMAVRGGDDILVIDGGLMFPEAELLGVDIVVPDISYLTENRDNRAASWYRRTRGLRHRGHTRPACHRAARHARRGARHAR